MSIRQDSHIHDSGTLQFVLNCLSYSFVFSGSVDLNELTMISTRNLDCYVPFMSGARLGETELSSGFGGELEKISPKLGGFGRHKVGSCVEVGLAVEVRIGLPALH